MKPSLKLTKLLRWDTNLLELQMCSSTLGSNLFPSLGKTIALIPPRKEFHCFWNNTCISWGKAMLDAPSWVKAPADVNLSLKKSGGVVWLGSANSHDWEKCVIVKKKNKQKTNGGGRGDGRQQHSCCTIIPTWIWISALTQKRQAWLCSLKYRVVVEICRPPTH